MKRSTQKCNSNKVAAKKRANKKVRKSALGRKDSCRRSRGGWSILFFCVVVVVVSGTMHALHLHCMRYIINHDRSMTREVLSPTVL